jgi:hypothetical protein
MDINEFHQFSNCPTACTEYFVFARLSTHGKIHITSTLNCFCTCFNILLTCLQLCNSAPSVRYKLIRMDPKDTICTTSAHLIV